MSEKKVGVPSEMRLERKWDWALTEFGSKMTVGTLACGVLSFVLLGRARVARAALTTFGTGFGAGWAYKVVQDDFAKEINQK
jgi:hypothetical protein